MESSQGGASRFETLNPCLLRSFTLKCMKWKLFMNEILTNSILTSFGSTLRAHAPEMR